LKTNAGVVCGREAYRGVLESQKPSTKNDDISDGEEERLRARVGLLQWAIPLREISNYPKKKAADSNSRWV